MSANLPLARQQNLSAANGKTKNPLTKEKLDSVNYLAGNTGAHKSQATDIRKTTRDLTRRSNVSRWKRHFLAQKTSEPAVN